MNTINLIRGIALWKRQTTQNPFTESLRGVGKKSSLSDGKSFAFTLAEVLITLGVIGVVASITIPTMFQSVQKRVFREQFKKRYAVLVQAYRGAQGDLGGTPDCWYWQSNPYPSAKCVRYNDLGNCAKYEMPDGSNLPSDYNGKFSGCAAFAELMKEHLKVIQDCKQNAYANGCIPAYTGIDDIRRNSNKNMSDYDVNKATSGCSGYRTSNLRGNKRAFVLADGSIITFYGSTYFTILLIDVNGKGDPNQFGYDVFPMMTRSGTATDLRLMGGGCEVKEPGGVSAATIISNLHKNR